jgi:hemoglobin
MTITADTHATVPGEPPALAKGEEVNLYEAIGGRPALVAAVDGLYGRLLADPELAPLFPRGAGERHRRYVVTFLAEALGGPHPYRGPGLPESHRGLGITGAHFERTAAHLVVTLDELGVPTNLVGQVVAAVAGLQPAIVTA